MARTRKTVKVRQLLDRASSSPGEPCRALGLKGKKCGEWGRGAGVEA